MRGHIRRRGDPGSWEYIIDVGMATAQRCQSCGTRFWMERKPKPCCPKCGGTLLETEERRRKTQAGFATRKDAEAAMCKVMTRGRGAQLRRPHSHHREGVPAEGVAAGDQGHRAADHLRQLCDPRRGPHRAGPRIAAALTSLGPGDQRLLCQAAGERSPARQGLPLPRHRAARACHPASGPQGCRALATAGGQSGRCRRSTEGQEQPAGAARLERGAAGRLSLLGEGRSPLRPLAAAGDDRLPSW